jgi:NADH-quinone oxidoreductase subunit N
VTAASLPGVSAQGLALIGELDFSVLAPLGFVAIGSMLVLLLEVALSRRVPAADGDAPDPLAPAATSRIGIVLAIVASLALILSIYAASYMFWAGVQSPFHFDRPMLQLDSLSTFAIALIGVGSLLSVWISITYLPALRIDHGEYYALLLLSTTGMFALVSAVDLMTVFLGLELTSIPIYAMAGFNRGKLYSNEAALKYFLLGAFASAVLLYGMALLYGATGHTDFIGISQGFAGGGVLALAGLALVIAGFAFKIAAVPFHQWAPDVYEGAPTSVTAFLAVTVKTAGFVALLRFLVLALPEMGDRVSTLFEVLAAITMLVGNVMAVIQNNLKRMLAYSSIAHSGYMLVAFATGTPEAWTAVLFYLIVYVFMTLGVFCVIASLSQGGREWKSVDDFAGLASRRPALAALMTLFMLSLAGIPGTAGFMAKFYLFVAAVNADQIVLVLILVATSIVSVFYYLRLPIAMYMREPREEPRAEPSSNELVVLAICAAAVLYLAFFSNGDPFGIGVKVVDLAGQAADFLH